MVVVLSGLPSEMDQKELEHLASRVFFKAIDLLGGLNKLTEYRTLTWLPSLARAAYVVVLKDEYLKSEEEIAQKVGLTKNTVRNILRADPTAALEKLKRLEELVGEEKKELKVHTAGGIAKLAYKMVKEGGDAETLIHYCERVAEDIVKTLDIPWAYVVLKHSKGTKYPIQDPSILSEKLKDIKIKGIDAQEIIQKLHYPIRNPAQLLHEIKLALSEYTQ
ncbi:bacterio-opsin activator [Thermocrinis minervae]|uniref:Probable regulatory domain-containing protein n=1 Tax=Thermocrinis minervae TaxID=381751 RepID=A0A1M6QR19_9AQUI|nr:bacterio-opsin activator [Thermocrinis minervae]SHK22533.1 probable regulatory domain-containing protein [Thermocrinis minervae]